MNTETCTPLIELDEHGVKYNNLVIIVADRETTQSACSCSSSSMDFLFATHGIATYIIPYRSY